MHFFAARLAPYPDELTDETFDRVCRRLAQGETIRAPDVARYCLGVARNVLYEAWDRQRSRPTRLDLPEAGEVVAPLPEPDDEGLACLERCLETLPPESRDLLLRYHAPSSAEKIGARRALAQALGIGPNALRIRLHRLRARLGACVVRCLARKDETIPRGNPPSDGSTWA